MWNPPSHPPPHLNRNINIVNGCVEMTEGLCVCIMYPDQVCSAAEREQWEGHLHNPGQLVMPRPAYNVNRVRGDMRILN